MIEYLIGIMYHETKAFALWNRGVIEDYESSAYGPQGALRGPGL